MHKSSEKDTTGWFRISPEIPGVVLSERNLSPPTFALFLKTIHEVTLQMRTTKIISLKELFALYFKLSFFYKHLVLGENRLNEWKVASGTKQHSNPDSRPGLKLPVPPTTSQNVNLTANLVPRIIRLHLHQYHDHIYLPLADCSSPLSFSTSAFFLRKFPLARKASFFAFFRCCSFSERRNIFFR